MDRINEIFSNVKRVKKFADVGCDHGYVSELVVKNGIAEQVIITDISKECLKKAEGLLAHYIEKGLVKSLVTDGLKGVDEDTEEVLIAGMGGEEIIKILSSSTFKPEILVLQPMKNQDKVREYLINSGYKIEKDYTFFDKKFYDLIIAVKGKETLSPLEIKFGKTNLLEKPKAFIEKLQLEISKKRGLLSRDIKQITKEEIEKEIKQMEDILC